MSDRKVISRLEPRSSDLIRISRRDRGFTLIEVMLAAVIGAVLAAAVFGTLAAGRDASRRTEVTGEIDQIARQSLDRIVGDFRLARQPLKAYDSGFVAVDGGEGVDARDEVDFVTASPLPPPDAIPASTSATGVVAAPASAPARAAARDEIPRGPRIDLARVRYFIDVDESTPERGLVRAESRLLSAAAEDADRDAERTELAPEVVALDLQYFGDAGKVKEWDSRQSDALPQAVDVALTVRLERYGEVHERTVRTIVRCLLVPAAVATGE